MIKIYKNNGFIYINNDNKIELNSLIIKNYSLYKDKKTINEIMNISKKQYYEKLGCNYSLTWTINFTIFENTYAIINNKIVFGITPPSLKSSKKFPKLIFVKSSEFVPLINKFL